MKHLNLSLVDAYLIVRSRRLSVLIQPNMRLLYNLCGWEVELARRRVEQEVRQLQCGRRKGKEAGDVDMDVDVSMDVDADVDVDADRKANDDGEGAKRRGENGHGGNGNNVNGRGVNGHSVNGHSVNGHSVNGHNVNGHNVNGQGGNGHGGNGQGGNENCRTNGDGGVDSDEEKEAEAALRRVLKKSLNWPYLAREVHLLNEKYLH